MWQIIGGLFHSPLFLGLTVLIIIDVGYATFRLIAGTFDNLLELVEQKFTIFLVVVVALTLETITPNGGYPLTDGVMLFYCGVEALQILQAAAADGLPLPPQLKGFLDGLVGKAGTVPGGPQPATSKNETDPDPPA